MRTSDDRFTPLGVNCSHFSIVMALGGAFGAEKQRAVPPFLFFKMKQHYAKIILLCLCCLIGAKANAHDFEVDGIYYNYNGDGTSVSVTYKGYEYDSYNDVYTGEVTIPESVTYNGKTYSKTYSVTSIDYEAFRECRNLTSVSIPKSVTTIGDRAFDSCSGLTWVIIPNSVTRIGDYAFYGCI